MKVKDEYFIYLGGSHHEEGKWREAFATIARDYLVTENFSFIGVDPFCRNIDENDNHSIVSRDVTILCDRRLRYVVLKSVDVCGSLTTGTACELILARSLNKPVIVLIEERSEEENTFTHPFTEHFATKIATSVRDAICFIKKHIVEERLADGLMDDIAKATGYPFNRPDINPFQQAKVEKGA